jgi:hypothetical protein
MLALVKLCLGGVPLQKTVFALSHGIKKKGLMFRDKEARVRRGA